MTPSFAELRRKQLGAPRFVARRDSRLPGARAGCPWHDRRGMAVSAMSPFTGEDARGLPAPRDTLPHFGYRRFAGEHDTRFAEQGLGSGPGQTVACPGAIRAGLLQGQDARGTSGAGHVRRDMAVSAMGAFAVGDAVPLSAPCDRFPPYRYGRLRVAT